LTDADPVRADGVRVELWPPARARDDASKVWRVYDVVFADQESESDWRASTYDRHCLRDGFRFAAAVDGDQLVGFAYGYIGERGQYWPDRVVQALPGIADDWVGGHFEFVELAVLPAYRRRGVGGALHDLLMGEVGSSRALLSTDGHESPAVALYRSRGWATLGLLEPGVQVMGKRT
jgi:ribosomal protein S18 acetylase RimI-like enzyme